MCNYLVKNLNKKQGLQKWAEKENERGQHLVMQDGRVAEQGSHGELLA